MATKVVDNKNLITNGTAIGIVCLGFLLKNQMASKILIEAGFFAFSGAITNWLAIHMLFEKVPGLYGSGIIPKQFKAFKSAIRNMILQQFFTQEQVKHFFSDQLDPEAIKTKLISNIKFDKIYQDLSQAIMASSFGGMLGMFGGEKALEPLKEPVTEKLKASVTDLMDNLDLKELFLAEAADEKIVSKIEEIVDNRLNELTPEQVKSLVQDMIRKHLGWLVVWGGVFGGLIGVVVAGSRLV